MRRLIELAATLAICVLFVPALAYAQASITGVVRDASGAVLPGVTVEASSPALIEKVRAAVTDGSGQYRIENLRPGTYEVNFTLTGFRTVKREGIELTGSFVASVNADLQVGSVSESITVNGETPVVDVQSAKRQEVLTSDVVAAIPTGRSYNALMVLIPGVAVTSADIATGPCGACTFGLHGQTGEGRVYVDGIPQGASLAGTTSGLITDPGNSEEVNITTTGGLGESETSGPVMNFVPKTGGNSTKGMIFAGGSTSGMQGSNTTQALKNAGLVLPSALISAHDVSGSVGGPLLKDKLWYFTVVRDQAAARSVTNMYNNLNAGNPNAWTYSPDLSHQALFDRTWDNARLSLTWQASPRVKLGAYWDEQAICARCTGANPQNGFPSPTTSPEALGHGEIGPPSRTQQLTFASPVTNRLLFEAGWGTVLQRYGGQPGDSPETVNLTQVTEQCVSGCPSNGNIPGLLYRSQSWSSIWNAGYHWHATGAYVTGAHSMKFGYQGGYLVNDNYPDTNSTFLSFRFNNAIPNQLTEFGYPLQTRTRTQYAALFAQEQWTLGRLTLQGAVRYDNAWSYAPDQQIGPNKFIPNPLVFPAQSFVNWKDVTPKMGVAYDLFGTGKTALRVNLGKYLSPATAGGVYAGANPTSRIVTSVTRTWTDANGNYVPDCNLQNPGTQDLRSSGGDFCGPISNSNFGKNVFSTTYDPGLLQGWGIRPSDWNLGVSVQQQLLPRTSMEVGYFRRWFNNFNVTENLAAAGPANYNTFSITAPLDPRLPGGGGQTISGLYDVNPALFGQTNNLVTLASNFGNQYQHFDGLDVTFNVRPRQSLTFQGGVSTGRTVSDDCAIRAQLPGVATTLGTGTATAGTVSATNPYCHVDSGFLTQVRGLAAYTIPRVDVLFSAAFQSVPGQPLAANYTVPNSAVVPSLGRSLAGNAPNVTVNLFAPGTLYGDRTNQIDLRLAKILKFGRTRTQVGLDVYNVLNSSAVLGYNQAYILNGAWLTPNSVITGRFAKISAQFDF
jgi:Carboxypeptidase regulatory-like domain